MIIESLVAELGIEVDQTKLKAATHNLENVKKSFFGIKTAVAAAALALFAFERKMVDNIFRMGKTSKMLGITTDQFQTLQLAASRSGTSFDTVKGAVQKLDSQLAGAKIGEFPTQLAKGLSRLDAFTGKKLQIFDMVDGKKQLKTGMQLFSQIAAALDKVKDRQTRVALSQQLFGQNLNPVLQQLSAARKDVGGLQFGLSSQQIKQTSDLFRQMAVVSMQIKQIWQQIAAVLAADFLPFFKGLEKFFSALGTLRSSASRFEASHPGFTRPEFAKPIDIVKRVFHSVEHAVTRSPNPGATTTNDNTVNHHNNNTTINSVHKSSLPSLYQTGMLW